ncbi:hypothetical protein GCM10018793_51820 [Streptomyces sulfonofaciens]|uniref:Uncharacterized protein n=1 Tax=Streptomyces sulfonofaciens TaxID=68272 RepID=A0A919GJI1_9ACTN|nr:hypothetical protein GCM10018793_51820 [Streptomyces sulfonofaciens]
MPWRERAVRDCEVRRGPGARMAACRRGRTEPLGRLGPRGRPRRLSLLARLSRLGRVRQVSRLGSLRRLRR